MKKATTHFLRVAIIIIGLVVLAICIFALPSMSKGMGLEFPMLERIEHWVVPLYVAAIPFFLALWQGLKLLNYIDKNKAFSELSVMALRKIKYFAVAVSLCLYAALPFMFQIAQADDAPGIILMWGAVASVPIVIAVFAALLQKLLKNAIDIKNENDLVV
ncbi:MAG: DUF2975 domain-containing protein [Candidatus Pacebacteria bacterium]|nr:DUF2975 domain-containing protein [Candidatus Paceibacterota bacterium]MBP9852027.1 DUF2975 domain-containing protein [Candidatus Paceibacterota bacterium]